MLKILLCLLCLALPLSAHGKLYKIVDDAGRITFSDKAPTIDAQEHTLGEINTIGNDEFNLQKGMHKIRFTTENGTMIVQGKVNGISMRFIVDTGATLVAIPKAVADAAKLPVDSNKQMQAMTANGTVTVLTTQANELMIDKVKRSNVAAAIQDISPTDTKLGLLGMSFFETYKMTINQAKSEILLEDK
ncbi:MAG: hypothetical protein AUK35_10645 [Zetaproteobacteria bacterium CG2_30_46_52]|nr:MAG: hypothetical protein AUK35_10645 [Zetaproteobacteria bacterium CG2_30_46_52]